MQVEKPNAWAYKKLNTIGVKKVKKIGQTENSGVRSNDKGYQKGLKIVDIEAIGYSEDSSHLNKLNHSDIIRRMGNDEYTKPFNPSVTNDDLRTQIAVVHANIPDEMAKPSSLQIPLNN